MRLIRFGAQGTEKPGVLLKDDIRVDVSSAVGDYDELFFANNGVEKLHKWLEKNESTAPRVPSSVRLGPPVCRPSKIVCVGLNYRAHAG